MVVIILETVEKVKKNRDDVKELCANIMEIVSIIQNQLSSHGDTAAVKFKGLCEDFEGVLQGILKAVQQMQTEPRGFRIRFKEVVKLGSVADAISGHRFRIQELRSNFLLMATIDINLHLHKALSIGMSSSLPPTPVTQSITKCPLPSRIFHGRQIILDTMHQFFKQNLGKQHIFLLHGLGGSGKTQIALKFIQESSSCFSDIFLIDTSTIETIDTGLKNIAETKNVGSTADHALEWLSNQPEEWLVLFDNADHPNINLHKFFPACTHGHILITSRNPGLRVYAGSHCLVSDMEELDATELLLKSAGEDITPGNKGTAAGIALWYLPLAIVQAGAFISKSGALGTYLDLFKKNKAQLLREQPTQSHSDYAWTVYTTWQISFEQLTKEAKTLLQLWSFLHHEGISEEIFSRASSYKCHSYSSGPSEEELCEPIKFISQFMDPAGVWDSLHFIEVITELKSYSLVNFDPDKKSFSVHPLVHSWIRTTLTDPETCHYSMVAIVGMAICGVPNQDKLLASFKLLPHVDSLIRGNRNVKPDFRYEYGELYWWTGRLKDAEQLELAVVQNRRDILGDDHPDTLHAMASLASTYHKLGRLKEAEHLQIVVLEKQKEILEEDHPDTLHAMGNLASTFHNLGQLKEAEELEVVVFEKRIKILGEDHPGTLRAMVNLASTYYKLGQLKEAEELEVVVLEKRRKILGEDHPDTLNVIGHLASTYHDLGQLKEAEELRVVVLEKRRKILGEDHPDTLHTMDNLAATHCRLGRFSKAEKLYVGLLAKHKAVLGDNHRDTIQTMGNLAVTRQAMDGTGTESETDSTSSLD
ncbi:P-loop containing nucleoside triphosphate hydrolase protein [Mycena rosella]|uniref:P-loop containing nucleoside triphosphate hydrolase protein n=1 Tax=Mycena rosella TaxID=1033263 RepID=A0AAD7C6R0_MYCRO|nr:P-loop containing nucleoside triphosphate hydrolase protein [Mycena rosella]